ncbi:MAG: hypothetical protein GY847_26055 [Proteobacteria bacterium]|nr:hypothetical protein [Pseudomonadota bacterium]
MAGIFIDDTTLPVTCEVAGEEIQFRRLVAAPSINAEHDASYGVEADPYPRSAN